MPIAFDHPVDVVETTQRTAEFVRDVVLPVEDAQRGSVHSVPEEMRRALQDAAREGGVFGPHVDPRFGGLGLTMCDRAPVFEAAGHSLFGPLALNCAAPDEGNVHLLEHIATTDQQERYLGPLATGKIRSCFAMTEPAPWAGSDPTALTTTAQRTSTGWLINGRKWFITGANGAAFAIVMARTSGEPGDRGGLTFYRTFGYFKLAVIAEGIHRRHLAGATHRRHRLREREPCRPDSDRRRPAHAGNTHVTARTALVTPEPPKPDQRADSYR